MITYEFNLDMSHGGLPLKFGLKQYDSDFSLIFKLFARKGTLNITSGTTVKIRGTKPDGRGYSVAASLSGSTVTVTGDQQMTAVAGMVPFELTLVKSGKELNTATFFVYVERAALDLNTIPSESKIQELYDLTESVDDILEAAASVEAAAESIANESAQIAKNKEINEIQQGLIPDLYTKKTDIDVSSTISNYALKGDGTRKSDSNSELKIYTVTAGNVLYLSLANDSDCTYQWQNSSTVPTSGTPTALIGTPVTGAVDTFVRVPTGATRLIVSKLKTTSTNIVKSATAKTDENAQAIENFRITVDDTLSQTGEAADAAAVGAAINTLNGSLGTERTFSESDIIQGTFDTSGAVVSSTSKIRIEGFVEVLKGDVLSFTQGTNITGVRYGVYSSEMAWVRTENWQDASGNYTVTADGYLIIVFRKTGDADITPSDYDATLIHKSKVDLGALKSQVDSVIDGGTKAEITASWANGNGYVVGYGSNKPVGTVKNDTQNMKASNFIDVRGYKAIIIRLPRTAETVTNVGLCFYDHSQIVINHSFVPAFCGRVTGDTFTDVDTIYVPRGAAYFKTTYWKDDYVASNCPTEVFECYGLRELSGKDTPITHDVPMNKGLLNAVRRARQLTDIEWEPTADIPRYSMIAGEYSGVTGMPHFLDWFKSGKKYKGVPYSGSGSADAPATLSGNTAGQWGYYYMYVGLEIDPETFITAIRTPNSIMASKTEQSAYNYDSSPYGIVCNGLVSYALAKSVPVVTVNNFVKSANGFVKIGDVATMDIDDIRIGDVLHCGSVHVAIVTDVIRDKDGHVTDIEVSEATTVGNNNNSLNHGESILGGVCRRKFFRVDDFKLWERLYSVNRYMLIHTIGYTPSDYVDTGNEGNSQKWDVLPCVPYLGNKARYKVGYIPNTKICINTTGFTSLVVTKDGETFGTFAVSGLNEVEVGFSAAGDYTAYLTDGSHNTVSCSWSVVPMDYT